MEIARRLWTGQPVDFSGRYFQLRGARINFPCRHNIEVHWAARGPKMLRLGGELADVVFLHGNPHSEIAEAVRHVRAGALEAQRKVRIHLALPIIYDQASFESGRLRTACRLVDLTEDARRRLDISTQLHSRIRELVLSSQLESAAQLVEPELVRQFVVDATDPESLRDLARTIASLNLDGFIVEISNPYLAATILPVAHQVIAKTMQLLKDQTTGSPQTYQGGVP